MGNIIQFPEGNRLAREMRPGEGEDATIIILPSIRIERHHEASPEGGPTTTDTTPRRRRGRGR